MTEGDIDQRAFAVPPDATEVVLVRHGASAPVVPGELFPLLDGHGDPPLAPMGGRQALAVAERLAPEPLAGLFVTPLQRTAQTAAPLARRLSLEPVVVPDLREVHLGDWEGGEYRVRLAQGDPLVARVFAEERWDVIPNAEDPERFAARVRGGVLEIVGALGPGAMGAAFVHGGVIAELCRQATASRPFAFLHADNASISRLVVFADGSWLLRSFNEIAHLA
ncbi:MAG: 2,3-bisphosphoglycerate-dependent phosphoglycerate mutase [Solirubrobacteraceae bacterium]|nr:2,3-bisphosphoglycerate-dependent phosphoglycerate mutase [Solirubrobacteraceae bacterium]